MRHAPPTVLAALAALIPCALAAGCQTPAVESVGGRGGHAPAGGEGGGGDTGGAGGASGARDASFTVSFPDADDGGTGAGGAVGAEDARSCAGESHQGKLVPVDLLFLIDTSGSMEENAGPKSKWMAVREAITSFIADPQSAGLGVGLETFPAASKVCTRDAECGVLPDHCGRKGACAPPANVAQVEAACYTTSPVCADGQPCTPFGLCSGSGLRCAGIGQPCPGGAAGDMCLARLRYCTDTVGRACAAGQYEVPLVPIAELPGVRASLEAALAAVVPEGATPTTPAAQGALAHLRARALASADRKQVLVLATDGMPSMCAPGNTVETAAAALAAARAPGIATYVVGVFSAGQLTRAEPALQQLATAGGTGAPFVLTAGADLTQKFIEAINEIRNSAQTCEFMIPTPSGGPIDYDRVNVRLTGAAGNEDLGYVGSVDRCDPTRGGWYYDVDPRAGMPTRVRLCEASCRKTKVSVRLSVDLRFGCQTIVIK